MSLNIKIVIFLIPILFTQNVLLAETFQDNFVKKYVISNGYLPDYPAKKKSTDATSGKKLFNSRNLSLNGSVACADCHFSEAGSADGLPIAVGIKGSGVGTKRFYSNGKLLQRNTLSLWGVGEKNEKVLFWDGRVDFSEDYRSQFGSNPPSTDPLVTAVHLPAVEIRETLEEDEFVHKHKIESTDSAKALYQAITANLLEKEHDIMQLLSEETGIPLTKINFLHIAQSISSFIRDEFRLQETKLSNFVKGNVSLNKNEIEGAMIFYGKGGCSNCHSGKRFTDQNFHVVPFPQLGFGKNGFGVDYGRYNITFNPDDLYKFRTPSLINVALTKPYGHSGSVYSLSEAITAHFDPLSLVSFEKMSAFERFEFFKRLELSSITRYVNFLDASEVDSLVAFLETLTFENE